MAANLQIFEIQPSPGFDNAVRTTILDTEFPVIGGVPFNAPPQSSENFGLELIEFLDRIFGIFGASYDKPTEKEMGEAFKYLFITTQHSLNGGKRVQSYNIRI